MLAVLCLSVVRDLHEVLGDLLPSPFPLLVRTVTVIHTLTESADMVRAENISRRGTFLMSRAKSLRIITYGVKEALLCCLSFVDLFIEFLSDIK